MLKRLAKSRSLEALNLPLDPDMMNDFITNSSEIMESLNGHILALEADPSSKEVIEEIFRGAHTLKGAAGMFDFKAIERIMHKNENYLI